MKLYLNYTQVPEIKSLPNDEIRKQIHTIAKTEFDEGHPNVGIRGLLIVAGFMGIVCLVGNALLADNLDAAPLFGRFPVPLLVLGAMGAWIGALLHFHIVLCEMRSYYRRIIARQL